MPKNMDAVEAQCEDVLLDMEVYTGECGRAYDFACGLNWKGGPYPIWQT
jgi:beta-glucosidase